jgi:hypothetical protein
MLSALDNLPEDPTELREVSELLAAEVKALTLKVEQLQHQLHGANRHRFALRANKSETYWLLKFTLEGAGERTHGYALTGPACSGCCV